MTSLGEGCPTSGTPFYFRKPIHNAKKTTTATANNPRTNVKTVMLPSSSKGYRYRPGVYHGSHAVPIPRPPQLLGRCNHTGRQYPSLTPDAE